MYGRMGDYFVVVVERERDESHCVESVNIAHHHRVPSIVHDMETARSA